MVCLVLYLVLVCVLVLALFLFLFLWVFLRRSSQRFEDFFPCCYDSHVHKDFAENSEQLFLPEAGMILSSCFSWCPEPLPQVSKQLQTHLCKGGFSKKGKFNFSKEGKAAEVPALFLVEAKGSALVSALFLSHHEQA